MKALACLLIPLLTAAPVRAQDYRNCPATNGAATCAGWVLGAAICYDREHPSVSRDISTTVAARMLTDMGVSATYLQTSTAQNAALEYVREFCR